MRPTPAGVGDNRVESIGRKQVDHPPRLIAGEVQLAVMSVQGSAARLTGTACQPRIHWRGAHPGVSVDVRGTRGPECNRSEAPRGSAAHHAGASSGSISRFENARPSAASAARAAERRRQEHRQTERSDRGLETAALMNACQDTHDRIGRGLLKRKAQRRGVRQKFRAALTFAPDCSMSLRAVSKSSV